jgi:hypothetical protein
MTQLRYLFITRLKETKQHCQIHSIVESWTYQVLNLKDPEIIIISVLDLVSQIRDVVLVRRTFSSGKPQGVGNLEWGGDGDGEISLRATWAQGGWDPITERRVSK